MIGNVWLDRASGELTYNIEQDARYPLLTEGADVDKSTEIDPTQRAARTEGRSPAAMLVSTFSDELTIHTVRRAKVFGVSIKDRGAVSLAGHTGKAFWFSKAAGEFVTGRFYYDRYPDWVKRFNASDPTRPYQDGHWELSLDREHDSMVIDISQCCLEARLFSKAYIYSEKLRWPFMEVTVFVHPNLTCCLYSAAPNFFWNRKK